MTLRNILKAIILISAFVCLMPSEGRSQFSFLYRVNTTSDTVVAGACANPPAAGCSLRGAIQAAHASAPTPSVIEFAIPASDPFCAAGACTINLMQTLPIISVPISINGPGADKLTVRHTNGFAGSVFEYSASGISSILDLTISNGNSLGGGIRTSAPVTLNISNCVLTGNIGGTASAIANLSGKVNLINSTITGNNSPTGRTILNTGQGATLNITNSTISGNVGGGVINTNDGVTNITNSTVSNNSQTGGQTPGGIYNSSGTFSVKGTIVALNSGTGSTPDVAGNFTSAGFNLIGKIDGGNGFIASTDQSGTNAVPLDPKFDPSGLQYNGGKTKTITLLSGSPAIDRGTSLGLNGILTTDQRGSQRKVDDAGVQNAVGGDGADIGALERRESPADFDGDGRTDISIFRPSPGEWWYVRSSTSGNFATQFGAGTDKIAPADFTGDGKTDIAFWRPSTGSWFVLRSEDFSFFSFPFGTTGDIPAPADYDGDGKADAAVFRPAAGTWFIQNSGGGTDFVGFGALGDKSVAGDYDGDGRADIAIWRPSVGQWWVRRSSNQSIFAVTFGISTDKAVQGDYTGDGKTDVAFWRASTGSWFILRSEDSSFFSFPFGTSGDTPSPGDYDGDGRFDATVFRSSNSTWFSQRSSAGTLIQQFGASSDLPVPNAFVP